MDSNIPTGVQPESSRLHYNQLRGHYDNWMYIFLAVIFLTSIALGLIQSFVGEINLTIELDFYEYGVDISIDKQRIEQNV